MHQINKLIPILFVLLFFGCETDTYSPFNGAGTGGSTAKFEIAKDHLYVLNGSSSLKVFNLNSDGSPSYIKEITLRSNGIETIFAKDSLLFFGASDGMLIYDLANPSSPNFITKYEHVTACDPVYATDSIAYVTLRSGDECTRGINELHVLDISNLYQIELLYNLSMMSPHGLSINSDSVLVISERSNGISLLSLRNPKQPELLNTFGIESSSDNLSIGPYVFSIGKEGFDLLELHNGDSLSVLATR